MSRPFIVGPIDCGAFFFGIPPYLFTKKPRDVRAATAVNPMRTYFFIELLVNLGNDTKRTESTTHHTVLFYQKTKQKNVFPQKRRF